MRSVEATGKTLEEATAAAAELLNAAVGDLVIEVIEEPKKGVWGLLAAHEFRVRATIADAPAGADEQAPAPEDPVAAPEDASAAPETDAPADIRAPGDIEALADAAVEVINHIVQLMDLRAQAAVAAIEQEQVTIELTGEDAGRLIGHHGATLDALQLITSIIAHRDAPRLARLVLDAEGYRERREQMLREIALSHAEGAKQSGKEVVITDLKPYERRIVHLVLKEDPDIETYSEGEGDDRRLVISPKS